jgi:hypothetical protein
VLKRTLPDRTLEGNFSAAQNSLPREHA